MDTDGIVDRLDLEDYGIGVPASLALVGVCAVIFGVKGATMWHVVTIYGKIGVVTLFVVAIPCIAAGGYTYNEIETDWWMLSKDDAPDPLEPKTDEEVD